MVKIKPWYWRSLELDSRTASEVFVALFGAEKIATLLESPSVADPEYPQLARYSICAGAPRLVEGEMRLWTPQTGEILPFLRFLLQTSYNTNPDVAHLPFTGGWLGWLGYDLAWEIERLPNLNRDTLPFPVAYWYEPESFAVIDHLQQKLWLASTELSQLDHLETKFLSQSPNFSVSDVESSGAYPKVYPLGNPLGQSPSPQVPKSPSPQNPLQINFLTDREAYQNSVKQAKKYIQAGDIFQANLSLRFQTSTARDSWSIYHQLQQINPSPFASYWRSPWGDVISCSPERLIKLQNQKAETRPIAGTRPRGENRASDRALAEELLGNIKERAEHIMLVDLERNDLGRVCEWGSVEVDELLAIERYSHVMHLVSNVKGILQSDRDSIDLIRGVFPGGTITGCPKVRCMEIIEELEPVRRSLFYGSCGYLDLRGNLDLNILIRTLLYVPTENSLATVYGQVGAGIVADSDPSREWYESLNKAEAQISALQATMTED